MSWRWDSRYDYDDDAILRIHHHSSRLTRVIPIIQQYPTTSFHALTNNIPFNNHHQLQQLNNNSHLIGEDDAGGGGTTEIVLIATRDISKGDPLILSSAGDNDDDDDDDDASDDDSDNNQACNAAECVDPRVISKRDWDEGEVVLSDDDIPDDVPRSHDYNCQLEMIDDGRVVLRALGPVTVGEVFTIAPDDEEEYDEVEVDLVTGEIDRDMWYNIFIIIDSILWTIKLFNNIV